MNRNMCVDFIAPAKIRNNSYKHCLLRFFCLYVAGLQHVSGNLVLKKGVVRLPKARIRHS